MNQSDPKFLLQLLALALAACSSDGVDAVEPVCGNLNDDVTPAEFTWNPGATLPEVTGGAFTEGSYYLAEETLYGADPACEETIATIETRSPYARQALVITPDSDTSGTLEMVTAVSASPSQSSATYSVVDTTLSFSNVCGTASPFPEGVPFSADGDDLWFFPPQPTCGPEVAHFLRF